MSAALAKSVIKECMYFFEIVLANEQESVLMRVKFRYSRLDRWRSKLNSHNYIATGLAVVYNIFQL